MFHYKLILLILEIKMSNDVFSFLYCPFLFRYLDSDGHAHALQG